MTIFQNVRKGLLPARLSVEDIYSLQDTGVLSEREHFELVEGEIVPMAAAKANWHSIMESRLIVALANGLPEGTRLFPAPSITFADDLMLEPDFAIAPKHLLPKEIRGPDLLIVIEVADSSLAYDLRVKPALYARFGVREYWVVDAVRQTIRVHRAPSLDSYTDVEEYEAHDSVSALLIPDLTVRLDRLD